ncbi:MAG: RNA-binding protein [Deltaproteobacteria bacterium]|nr:RNA-binding protein [Deltaproteobacteria bacterium]
MEESKLYVGNLAFSSTENDLRESFGQYGTVTSVKLVTDRDTGRPRGFAFVEMQTAQEAKSAIQGLNETSIGGRTIQVSMAKPRESRGGGGGGGGGGGNRSRW